MSFLNQNNPFVGLRPFESDESLLFFGRQEQTLELLDRLHLHHFVAIVGGSGSGKSSFVRAGLIPVLKAGFLVDERDSWMISIMRPGNNPLFNLASALVSQSEFVNDESAVVELLQNINEQGVEAIIDFLQKSWKSNKTNFLLLIDQFEELFRFTTNKTNTKNKNEAIDFVNIFLELADQKELPIYVVVTMRSDFIGDCTQFFGLPEAMNKSQYLVPRLNRIQLKSVIEGPVKLFGGKINPALTSRLLNETNTVQDELPLLQHVLMRVWDLEVRMDQEGEVNYKDYEKVGGIQNALSIHAEEALQSLSISEKELTKKIFQVLTTLDENGRKIRRPAPLSLLMTVTGAKKEEILKIVNRFIEDNRSFLVIIKTDNPEDPVIDISHESLIRQWKTLKEWTDEEVENSTSLLRLVESKKLFDARKKDYLSGHELGQTLSWFYSFKPTPEWAELYSSDHEISFQYLKKSESLIKHKKEKNKIFSSIVVLVFISLAIGFFIFNKNKNEYRHQELEKQNFLHFSRNAREEGNLLKELLFYAEALTLTTNHDSLIRNVNKLLPPYYLRIILSLPTDPQQASFSNDPSILNTMFNDTIFKWNINDFKIIESHRVTMADQFFNYDPHPPLFHLLSKWGVDTIKGNVNISNLDTWTFQDVQVPRVIRQIDGGIFSHDKKQILSWGKNKDNVWSANIWNAENGKQIGTPLIHSSDFYGALFSDDNNRILTWSRDSTVRLWQASKNIGTDSIDLDYPADLFKLQIQVLTGVELVFDNINHKDEIKYISVDRWRLLYKEWVKRNTEHLEKCFYKKYNFGFLNQ